MADEGTERHPLPTDPLKCRQRAEDVLLPDAERLIWAVLAVAGELSTVRRILKK